MLALNVNYPLGNVARHFIVYKSIQEPSGIQNSTHELFIHLQISFMSSLVRTFNFT